MTRSSIFFPYWFPVHQQPWEVCLAVVLKLDPDWLKWSDTLLTTLRLITGTNKGGPLTLMFMPGLIIVIVLSPLCWLLPRSLNLRPATSQWVVLLATLLTFSSESSVQLLWFGIVHLAPPRADYEQAFTGANFNTEIVSGAPLRSPEHIF